MGEILSFKDVSLERGDHIILKHIDWTIHEKQNWAILGLNGAGKTTLLKLIHGDIWPTSGQLKVLGGVFGHTSIPELKRKIGWVSTALQDWLHPGDLVESIVLSGKFASIGVYEHYTEAEMDQAKTILNRLGGKRLIGKPYRVLSQGERQLVLIARALMAKPELLILDEPCNGLDLFAREQLLQRVALIAAEPNSPALLFVSHYTEELLPCFKNLLLLRNGEIVEKGSRQELLNEATLSKFYREPIQTLKLGKERVAVYPT
ncbi:molybdenum ABC transporter ATP-binding protein [Loigolactobacillus backii]|uniref:Molybdenum ABC transporter ATP-binding protein n=1 Tax=Loigolactobacillus backii TaxID=375175 RepID=A0A192GYI5_9LACO|nr:MULTISPECIES: ABC transporter ATP-binding protein [Loigolactobacillus]ANK60842.1 molybdenum ABC transporter ATP-binding protein [Loigolactobacillus backii]ANK61584.1 molybdenum ABC transporter ATP-binding protein [Loigolactobacillus backii]ANK65794.1 molybdenum ABC transporter ATP-binding protein [Loigolactobacillus backii]ANK68271.1 molybdenum ABC transporter ATP-binding protein [Loigolactobacillus backii]ANK69218.1 molybdenum ABC transporter ATP-binding protein [Loigolactobacillus backii]